MALILGNAWLAMDKLFLVTDQQSECDQLLWVGLKCLMEAEAREVTQKKTLGRGKGL